MTISAFKTAVLEYANRNSVVFNKTAGVDHVLIALNMARAQAQRAFKFQRACKLAYLDLTNNEGQIGSMKRASDNSAIKVRGIERAYVGTSSTNLYLLDFIFRDEQVQMISEHTSWDDVESGGTVYTPVPPKVVQHGDTLYIWGASATRLYFDVIEFLPEMTDASTADFFLEECVDWTMWRTLAYLNTFLKDDERMPISETLVTDAWEAVKAWDSSKKSSNAITLD